MKVLVTGGAGQVGSTVADLLLARGDAVLSIDNFATGRRDNLAPHHRLTAIEGSIVDRDLLERLFGEFAPDVVVHSGRESIDESFARVWSELERRGLIERGTAA